MSCQSFYPAISSRRSHHFPVPSVRPGINGDPVSFDEIASPSVSFQKQSDQNERIFQREIRFAGTQKNVSSGNRDYPKVNDTAVNDRTLGVTIQSCRMHADRLVTWKQIRRKKNDLQTNNSIVSHNSSQDFQLLDLELAVEDDSVTERELLIIDDDFAQIDNVEAKNELNKANGVTWLGDFPYLNQTYLIKDSEDIEEVSSGNRRHSPRVEFYFKKRENEIREFDKKNPGRKRARHDEEIRVASNTVAEVKINIEDKEENNQVEIRHKIEVSKADNKNKQATSSDKIEEHKIEKVKIVDEDVDEKVNQKANDVAEHYVRKVEINTVDEEDVTKMCAVNSETPTQQNLEIIENNLNTHVDNEFLRVEGRTKEYEENFVSDNFKNDTKEEKDFDTFETDDCLNDEPREIFDDSIVETEVTTVEDSHQKKTTNSGSVYNNDNVFAEAKNTRNDFESSVTFKNDIEASGCCRDGISLKTSVNFPKKRAYVKRNGKSERPTNSIEIKHKIRDNMDRFRGSTDSLVSSVELTELGLRRPEADCAYEIETIEIIRPSKRGRVLVKGLPNIRSESTETRKDSERSYWERTSKISRSKLIGLNSCHSGYKLPKRKRTCVLPPVPNSSLINER